MITITDDYARQMALDAKREQLNHESYMIASAIKTAAAVGKSEATVRVHNEISEESIKNLSRYGILIANTVMDANSFKYTFTIVDASDK